MPPIAAAAAVIHIASIPQSEPKRAVSAELIRIGVYKIFNYNLYYYL